MINHPLTNWFEVHYCRKKNKEVDFVIETGGKVGALEIKNSAAGGTDRMSVLKINSNLIKYIDWQKWFALGRFFEEEHR